MKKRVLVGISGGVDSAVSAYLLQQEGYEVVGGFMRNWDSTANNDFLGNPTLDNDICPQEQDYQDALSICEKLGIELLRIDFINEYWQYVFEYFIGEYQNGRTPNPDIFCNKFIKFDQFLKFAINNNFDYIAMGHYAKVIHTENDGSFLMKALDQNKDQTYFLSQLNQEQIKYALFPLANMYKKQVRELATSLDLIVADKKDSTGICFIGERDFRQFLTNYIPAQPGNILEYESKKIVGKHTGAMYYTLGQSKGLGIGGQKDFQNGKWYIMGKNLEKKEIYVANDNEQKYLRCNQVLVKDIVINNDKFKQINKCQAKFRYRQQETPVQLEWIDKTSCYVYSTSLPLAITPGQACVFYSDEYCCGGGIIEEIYLEGQIINYE